MLRDALPSEEHEREAAARSFEADLPTKIAAAIAWLKAKQLPPKSEEDLSKELCTKFYKCPGSAEPSRGMRIGDRLLPATLRRFTQRVKTLIRESMASSIATTFYACDYATKPNMVCAPLLVALRDGLARLETKLREEAEHERVEELKAELAGKQSSVAVDSGKQSSLAVDSGLSHPASASVPSLHVSNEATSSSALGVGTPPKRRTMSKLEREASRRLLRQATAAQQAQVKGNCLMICKC